MYLYTRLVEEVGELGRKIERTEKGESFAVGIKHEAADVANFAMMIADVCDGLFP
jgi:NTP pyrophosphatase (non-canonical NTP hydrolase)